MKNRLKNKEYEHLREEHGEEGPLGGKRL